ncbi:MULTISPECIES: elongation factor G [unclassified Tolypothrix]|uniref:elongation factor G n=1 Tax=unclassified Tolypothrix TaxID=2649714 RepID=UPI0005EABC7F|nr:MULTISPECIES: elongation factor G [unclassified Tolypothrix]BAY89614.1 translation elongation factor G [Microchaete diplosiphon NIES-3275]EKF02601.1 translation elongation factor G [Tolypothrix sp. PCC 7601]MBE9084766.1 elongation factor G [Tolypothrix sp. LEGE 11397]UYD23885.1 elongation factor G [Tolypothrix sp. PCC 7712]UYD33890.1 elongation factor G [Tolypothrix sp. PCC 7601]
MIPRERIRNIGISAHIDSGKTTLSERILFYTGRIHAIEEVRGGGKGATMDFMPEEKLHGITITSAATTCQWHDTQINLIDTPGHVDFTIEVERALRVLDGAVMVLCAVAGVQSQSITVDRQMKRYRVPRIAFINKMDRIGANPFRVVQAMRDRLQLNPLLLQYPIGSEDKFLGVIDLIEMQASYFEGENGENWIKTTIPDALLAEAQQAREKLLDALSLFSEPMTEMLLEGKEVPQELIWQTIRQATLSLQLTPVLLGSAFKNKGVQNLLDAIALYLPSPIDREVVKTVESVNLYPNPDDPLVALAFKLTVESFGQLTYTRIYSGTLKQGDTVYNSRTGQRVPIGRLVRMHANKREEVKFAEAGDIIALLGVDCASGDTFCGQEPLISLEKMFVPDPVITLAVTPKKQEDSDRLSKALNRFQKEDPTFKLSIDPESGATLISGMGELHLEIYLERIQREYNTEVYVGTPAVAYRETIGQKTRFDYRLKKQTGGSGQYAHVTGWIEPTDEPFVFESKVVGGVIPKEFIPACEKGFREAMQSGRLEGYPVTGIKVVLEGGSFHPIDSSELAFRSASHQALDEAIAKAKPYILEPIMLVEVETPNEYLGRVQGDLSSRRGLLLGSETMQAYSIIRAEVPLVRMFGYSTDLRSQTAGMATFTMEFACYRQAST